MVKNEEPGYPVKIDIEYCEVCRYQLQCLELINMLKNISNNIKTECIAGRRGAFEIKINDTIVYSKLKTMAFPDYEEVVKNVTDVHHGGPIQPIKGQQSITCVLS